MMGCNWQSLFCNSWLVNKTNHKRKKWAFIPQTTLSWFNSSVIVFEKIVQIKPRWSDIKDGICHADRTDKMKSVICHSNFSKWDYHVMSKKDNVCLGEVSHRAHTSSLSGFTHPRGIYLLCRWSRRNVGSWDMVVSESQYGLDLPVAALPLRSSRRLSLW